MSEMLSARIFDSRIKSEKVEKKEKWLGYFIGPISVILMNSILSNYLNVYYTDVLDISGIWGGLFYNRKLRHSVVRNQQEFAEQILAKLDRTENPCRYEKSFDKIRERSGRHSLQELE